MNRPLWGRLLTAMLTPFDERGELNRQEARRVAKHLIDDMGNDGLVVAGTTGESPTLKSQEKLELLEIVLDEVGDRASVVFGAGTYDTAQSIQLAQAAERLGAHGLMLVNPYYSKPGQRGLALHFRAIADEVQTPVMLYNIQPRASINLQTTTLLDLAQHERIVAVKEASGDVNQVAEVCLHRPDGFLVYSGDDGLTLPMLALGADGLVSVAAHVAGTRLKAMLEAWPSDPQAARSHHEKALPLIRAIFSAPSPAPIKYALSLRGFDCERSRLPVPPLDEAEKARVRAAIEAYDQAE